MRPVTVYISRCDDDIPSELFSRGIILRVNADTFTRARGRAASSSYRSHGDDGGYDNPPDPPTMTDELFALWRSPRTLYFSNKASVSLMHGVFCHTIQFRLRI